MIRRQKPIWLVPHPTYKFNEDVKELAAKNRLKVVDVKHADRIDPKLLAEKPPKLTLKKEYAPKKEAKVNDDSAANVSNS